MLEVCDLRLASKNSLLLGYSFYCCVYIVPFLPKKPSRSRHNGPFYVESKVREKCSFVCSRRKNRIVKWFLKGLLSDVRSLCQLMVESENSKPRCHYKPVLCRSLLWRVLPEPASASDQSYCLWSPHASPPSY